MELRKTRAKHDNQKKPKSRLFGIIDKSESLNLMIGGISDLSNTEAFKAQREIQSATLEAEYRKAQANELIQRMKYM